MINLDSVIKRQRHYFANKGPTSQSYGFSSSHVWIWELDYKESWALKNLCFWTVVLEKTLESPLVCKEIQPVHPKGNQPWIFIGRTDAEAETPILWPPDVKNWLIGKDPDAGKDWRRVEKGTTEDEMVGWHHRLSGHEFEQAPGVGDGQGGLACCSPWGCKESDTTEWLKWTGLNWAEWAPHDAKCWLYLSTRGGHVLETLFEQMLSEDGRLLTSPIGGHSAFPSALCFLSGICLFCEPRWWQAYLLLVYFIGA